MRFRKDHCFFESETSRRLREHRWEVEQRRLRLIWRLKQQAEAKKEKLSAKKKKLSANASKKEKLSANVTTTTTTPAPSSSPQSPSSIAKADLSPLPQRASSSKLLASKKKTTKIAKSTSSQT